MTPAELAADLRSLGVGVLVVRGQLRQPPPPSGWPWLFRESVLFADVQEQRNAVLKEMGVEVEPCPLCVRWVCPGAGLADCGRVPLMTATLTAEGVYTRDDSPRCPFQPREGG